MVKGVVASLAGVVCKRKTSYHCVVHTPAVRAGMRWAIHPRFLEVLQEGCHVRPRVQVPNSGLEIPKGHGDVSSWNKRQTGEAGEQTTQDGDPLETLLQTIHPWIFLEPHTFSTALCSAPSKSTMKTAGSNDGHRCSMNLRTATYEHSVRFSNRAYTTGRVTPSICTRTTQSCSNCGGEAEDLNVLRTVSTQQRQLWDAGC